MKRPVERRDQREDQARRRSARLCKLLLAGLEDGIVEEKVASMCAWDSDELEKEHDPPAHGAS